VQNMVYQRCFFNQMQNGTSIHSNITNPVRPPVSFRRPLRRGAHTIAASALIIGNTHVLVLLRLPLVAICLALPVLVTQVQAMI